LPGITTLLLNTLSKKPKRTIAWNIDLEIGPDCKFKVQSYIQCRKNTSTELKSALFKNVSNLGGSSVAAGDGSSSGGAESGPSTSSRDPDELVLASKGVEKEAIWTQEDGTVIDHANTIPAHYYGGRLVTLDG